ncbi:MAG: hypothetical protein U5L11_11310 [Arhodomonas sp.]|nr:hypothetical protein [Arhodomonas sp.]
MSSIVLIKGILLVIPAVLLMALVLPQRPWRLPAAVVIGAVAGFAAAAALPSGILAYVVSFAIMGSVYAMLSLGLNTQWGYTGHLNFGVAGFFAVGAFTSALVTVEAPTGMAAQYTQMAFGLDMPFLVGVAAAAVVSAVVAFLVAVPVLRLRMDFLAIATIGVAEIIRLIFQNERWLANGPQPLRGIPQPLQCAVRGDVCEWLPAWATALLEPLSPRDYPT